MRSYCQNLNPQLNWPLTSTHIFPTIHQEQDKRWDPRLPAMVYQPFYSLCFFPQSSLGPGLHTARMWYLQEYTKSRFVDKRHWLTNFDYGIQDGLVSSGTPGGPQGHLPPRTRYFLLFNSSYLRLQNSMFSKSYPCLHLFLKVHIFLLTCHWHSKQSLAGSNNLISFSARGLRKKS